MRAAATAPPAGVTGPTAGAATSGRRAVPLTTIALQWGRIGCTGFGGPPAHVALLRKLCVTERGWMDARDFEDGIAATNLLPGPASTQLAIYCAWRLAGVAGAVVGGLCFIVPGLVVIITLAALYLRAHPPLWVLGAAAGAGAAVPAVALQAAAGLLPASRRRSGATRAGRARWAVYAAGGAAAAATLGPWLVLVLVLAGLAEIASSSLPHRDADRGALGALALAGVPAVAGGLAAVAWVAVKVGLLSYGGGFVIVPLMQHDAVQTYRWMTGAQFLGAVALGQLTPGPVVQTVAVVGFAAGGLGAGLLAALCAFAPSFALVLAGGPRFDALRADARVQAFLTGAGAAAIGAIGGSAIPLGLALAHLWQLGILALGALWLLWLRRGAVPALVGAGALGLGAGLLGAPVR